MAPMVAEDAERMNLNDMKYGVSSSTSDDNVAQLLQQKELTSTVSRIEHQKSERLYHSHVREPLGKSFKRYDLPENAQSEAQSSCRKTLKICL